MDPKPAPTVVWYAEWTGRDSSKGAARAVVAQKETTIYGWDLSGDRRICFEKYEGLDALGNERWHPMSEVPRQFIEHVGELLANQPHMRPPIPGSSSQDDSPADIGRRAAEALKLLGQMKEPKKQKKQIPVPATPERERGLPFDFVIRALLLLGAISTMIVYIVVSRHF